MDCLFSAAAVAAVVLAAAAAVSDTAAAAAAAEAAAGEQKDENNDDPETGVISAHVDYDPFSAQMILRFHASAVRDNDAHVGCPLYRGNGAVRRLPRLHHIMLPERER